MESDEENAAAIVAVLLATKSKKKRKRSVLVKPWLGRRINLGLYETLVQELRFSINGSVLITFAIIKKCSEIFFESFFPSSIHKYRYSKICFYSLMFYHKRSNKFFLPRRHNLSMIFII